MIAQEIAQPMIVFDVFADMDGHLGLQACRAGYDASPKPHQE